MKIFKDEINLLKKARAKWSKRVESTEKNQALQLLNNAIEQLNQPEWAYKGRSPDLEVHEQVKAMLNNGLSNTEIIESGVTSRANFFKIKKSL